MVDYNNIILIIFILGILAYAYFVGSYVGSLMVGITNRRKERKYKKLFFKAIIGGLESKTIITKDDVLKNYEGVDSEYLADDQYLVIDWLKELLRKINSRHKNIVMNSTSVDYNSMSDDMRLNFCKKISVFIDEFEKELPYSELPEIERNILTDISNYLRTKDEKAIETKLSQLAKILKEIVDERDKFRNQNKWILPIAVIGLLLTFAQIILFILGD